VDREEIHVRRESLVRKRGLEPPRFYPPDPKSGAVNYKLLKNQMVTFCKTCRWQLQWQFVRQSVFCQIRHFRSIFTWCGEGDLNPHGLSTNSS
jgi:hypothetical protein